MASSSPGVQATVLADIVEDIRNQLSQATPLLDAMEKKGAVLEKTGAPIRVPAIVSSHSNIVALTSPSTSLSPNHLDPVVSYDLDWQHLATDIVLDEVSMREAQGDEAKIDLWQARAEVVLSDLHSKINDKLVGNIDSENIFNVLKTLNGMNATGTGSSTGLFESTGNTTTNPYGKGGQTHVFGLDKSLYNFRWNHQWATIGASYGTVGRGQIEQMASRCRKFDEKKQLPDLILMSPNGWSLQRVSNTGVEQTIIKGGSSDADFSYGDFTIMGIPVAFDIALEPNNTAASTTDKITAMLLSFSTMKLYHLPGCYYDVGEKESYLAAQSLAMGAPVKWSGQLVVSKLANQAVVVNGEA